MEADFAVSGGLCGTSSPPQGCVTWCYRKYLLAAEVNDRLVRGWPKLQQLETRLSTQKSILRQDHLSTILYLLLYQINSARVEGLSARCLSMYHVLKNSILLVPYSLGLQIGASSETLSLKPLSNHQNKLVSRRQTTWCSVYKHTVPQMITWRCGIYISAYYILALAQLSGEQEVGVSKPDNIRLKAL